MQYIYTFRPYLMTTASLSLYMNYSRLIAYAYDWWPETVGEIDCNYGLIVIILLWGQKHIDRFILYSSSSISWIFL